MRIKQRLDDFRVRELLADGFLGERGEHRVYRVTKRKLTSIEAARELAYVAGVPASEVALAGLKDRQGVTTQYMTIRRGREVSLRALDLGVESVGFAGESIASHHSLGNAFEVTLRGLSQEDLDLLRDNVPIVRECGVVNYFDEQRFGNLRHNQGWIAQQLMRGEHEAALKRLLASLSDHDDRSAQAFKTALLSSWGDWTACREVAGRFNQHHSVFEHLKNNEDDFAGAFYHVSSRLRLIHLYAFQSHIWNRAVADYVRSLVPLEERVVLEGVEGPMVYPTRLLPLPEGATFRLPGPGMEDVRDPLQRGLLEDALSRERMVAADFRIDGVSGFQLKGEERELITQPRHLRVRPPERDQLNYGAFAVKVRFELSRGAYATLVVRRLLSSPIQSAGRERGADRGQRDPRHQAPTWAAGEGAVGAAPRSDSFGQEGRGERGGWREQPARGERGHREREGRPFGRNRGPDQSQERTRQRPPPPAHRESGESLALPPRQAYGRSDRDSRGRGDDRGRDQGRPWQGPSRGGDRDRGSYGRGGPDFRERPRRFGGGEDDRGRGSYPNDRDRGGEFRPAGGDRPREFQPRSDERGRGFRPGDEGRGRGFHSGAGDRGREFRSDAGDRGREFRPGSSDRGGEFRPGTGDRGRDFRPRWQERPHGGGGAPFGRDRGFRGGQGDRSGGNAGGDRPYGREHRGAGSGYPPAGGRGGGRDFASRPDDASRGSSYPDRRGRDDSRGGGQGGFGGQRTERGGWQARPPRGGSGSSGWQGGHGSRRGEGPAHGRADRDQGDREPRPTEPRQDTPAPRADDTPADA